MCVCLCVFCVFTNATVYVCLCVCASTFACVHVCGCVYMCVFFFLCLLMCVFMHVFVFIVNIMIFVRVHACVALHRIKKELVCACYACVLGCMRVSP